MQKADRRSRARATLVSLFLFLAPQFGCAGSENRESRVGSPASVSAPGVNGWEITLNERLGRLAPFGYSGAVLVVEEGRRVHAGGYGFADRRTLRSNTIETAFDIGSLSKQFTAAAVLTVAERDRLSVEDSISKHLPGVPDDKQGITIHHLLTHTSGLPVFHDTAGDFEVMSREEAERRILDAKLEFPPGDRWRYSNSGYTLLAAIVERVSGRSFERVLSEEIFEPAGLERTGLYFQPFQGELSVARGYTARGDRGSPLEWTETADLWALIGNGGVLSTIEDLERWHKALRGGRILSDRARQLLFTPHERVREGLHSGYGWLIDQGGPFGPVVRHGGANDFGFAARWRRYEERDILVVLLLNREPPGLDVSFAADAVEAFVESAVLGNDLLIPPAAAGIVASNELERYVGRYRFDDSNEFVVGTTIDALAVEPLGPDAVRPLAFPGASSHELESLRQVDERAQDILEGITTGDYESFARVLADSSEFEFYRNFISEWWEEFREAGGDAQRVEVAGTVPMWWSPGDERLATLIRARRGERSEIFRLHWLDGRIVGLGGGAIREPATTLFAPTDSGDFIGYHLGIRQPVQMTFEADSNGEISTLRLQTSATTASARRVTD